MRTICSSDLANMPQGNIPQESIPQSGIEQNTLFHDRYLLERLIGRGGFSEVWLAKDIKTGVEVAIKIYAPGTGLDDKGLDLLSREFALVVNINHKNLLKPIFYDTYERRPYLILPFCKNGSISGMVGQFTESQAWCLLRDVASGLAFLHSMTPPILHQDIKPDNIMVSDNGTFMITDFGVSTRVRSTIRKSISQAFYSAGTIAYMAPERFGKDNMPVMANDIYSLGATVYEMLTGTTPFGDNGGLMQMKGAEIPNVHGDYSNDLKKVINQCLDLNPVKRPTAEQLERYSEMACRGERIHFENNSSKFKYVIGVSAAVLFVLIGVCLFLTINKEEEPQPELYSDIEKVEENKVNNDSLRNVINIEFNTAETLIQQGDSLNEGYELAYIEAYKRIVSAIELCESIDDDIEPSCNLFEQKDSVEMKLRNAHVEFISKYERFLDIDSEIADVFKFRASRIEEVIDILSFNNNN